jgi:hypothetical protein
MLKNLVTGLGFLIGKKRQTATVLALKKILLSVFCPIKSSYSLIKEL